MGSAFDSVSDRMKKCHKYTEKAIDALKEDKNGEKLFVVQNNLSEQASQDGVFGALGGVKELYASVETYRNALKQLHQEVEQLDIAIKNGGLSFDFITARKDKLMRDLKQLEERSKDLSK